MAIDIKINEDEQRFLSQLLDWAADYLGCDLTKSKVGVEKLTEILMESHRLNSWDLSELATHIENAR